MKNCKMGSTWKKCDLHFHTPISFDHQYRAQSPEETIQKLTSEGISLVAITDHYFIDAEYIQSLREASNGTITFLPGVEVRTDLGDDAVHMIGIFSEELDIKRLSNELCGLTEIYKEDLKDKRKLESSYTKHEAFIEFIRSKRGLLSIHAGCGRSGSFETIGNKDWCQRAFKTEFLKTNVNLLDVTKDKHVTDYKTIVFPTTGLCHPLVSGSDNHDIRSYTLRLPCWMKCDSTFKGLLQVISEPEERVYLGELPPALQRTQAFPTCYIQSVTIEKNTDSNLAQKWFNKCSLELNPGLVSIIGNKGNGKSALADILALLGNSHHKEEDFSFLNKQKFRHKKNGKAAHFHAQLTWLSGEKSESINLAKDVNFLDSERVKYIPQSFLEELCNEYDGKERFQNELQKVIYSHIPDDEKLGTNTLDGLVSYVANETLDAIHEIKNRLSKVNKNISTFEQEISTSNQIRLNNSFDLKVNEYLVLLSKKPPFISNPSKNVESKNFVSDISEKIERTKAEVQVLTHQDSDNKNKLRLCKIRLAKLQKLQERLTNFKIRFDSFKSESPEFSELELNIDDIITLKIDDTPIKQLTTIEIKNEQYLKDSTDINIVGSTAHQLLLKTEELKNLINKLSEPDRIYQNYINDRLEWKNQIKSIVGDKKTPETLRFIHCKIKNLATTPDKLKDLFEQRKKISEEIFSKKASLRDKYARYYSAVESFIKKHQLAQQQQFKLEFTVSIADQGCSERFLAMIDQGRAGSFYGKEAGRNKLEDAIIKIDFNAAEQAISFAEEVTRLLKIDIRSNVPQDDVSSQLVKGISISEVYDYIFSFDYLQPIYNLSWAGKELEQLSPGERGNLLLIFYLLIDQEQIPLILDQPEDNLDNHTIYKNLVPCIRDAKNRRQIIMVTHNPNLAVVCDSEQIIYAEIKKEVDSEVIFTCGAIENPEINKHVVDVLEGTRPAFDKRDSKYLS
ncbi:TrlF family AAA-like ATPase [Desulfovibrio sp. QI0434]